MYSFVLFKISGTGQHKNDFENLVDTVAMLEEADLLGDENGVGRLIVTRRKKFEEEYGIVS